MKVNPLAKYARYLVAFGVVAMLAACSSEIDDGMSEHDKQVYEEYLQRQDSLAKINNVTNGSSVLTFENGISDAYYQNRLTVKGARSGAALDTTIEYNAFISKVSIKVPFGDASKCNYSNTQFLYDGSPLLGEIVGDTEFVADRFMTSYDELHQIDIVFDSLNCQNIKEHYTLKPSECAGRVLRPEVSFTSENYSIDSFSVKAYPDYYLPQYGAFADTVNSKCFLKTPMDSLKLDMRFEEHELFSSDYYPAAFVSAKREDIENLLQGDDMAILKCMLVYQTWRVLAKLPSESYYTRRVTFKK